MATVHVSERDRIPLATDQDARTFPVDPLMRVLGQRAIRHKIVLLVFGSMIFTGGLISLLLI